MCLEAGNKSLRLNIALSPDLGGDCNGLLEGDQGLARSREFGCSFRIRPQVRLTSTEKERGSRVFTNLDSPVTSDIVKGDRLSNAEAHKEDVRL